MILHGVTFIIIFFLYQKIKEKPKGEKHVERRIQEFEDIFNSYLLELKDENKKFLQQMSEIEQKKQHSSSLDSKANNERTIEEPLNITETDQLSRQKNNKRNPYSMKAPSAIKAEHEDKYSERESTTYQPPTLDMEDQVEIQSTPSQIHQLHHQGLTIDEIAKSLDIGRTEVELILKFNQKLSK
ncbi:DUF6115 domain-containing protein [Halalkalibacillus halophilus]|uniref:DUF6115 domain-containing protein n=1 Tax=Halalkalibacillus halophilus TaxID=392827 RepID=UPI00040E8ED4|nr:hypothetical protein [Halalkalibacillus halophilus]